MKRFFILGAVVLVIMASCGIEPLPEPELTEQYLVFTASSSANELETKTIRQSDGAVWWSPADEISIFYARGDQGGNKFTSVNTEPKSVTDFTGTIGVITGGSEISPADTYFWALYPYDATASCNGSSITTTLEAVQEATPGTFADHVNIAIARSKGLELSFYNVCSGFKFSVTKEQVKRVKIRGNNGEILAGQINVSIGAGPDARPEIQSVTEGQTELILEAPGDGFFEVGTPYIVISLPVPFSNGFTVTFETPTESADFVYSNSYTLKRAMFVSKLEMDAGLEYHLRHVANCTVDTDVVEAIGGDVHVHVSANADYTLEIPAAASSWLSVAGNEGACPENLVFTAQTNESINDRAARIVLKDTEGHAMGEIIIRQKGDRVSGLLEVHVPSIGELDAVLCETGYNFEDITAMKVTGVLNDIDFLTIYYDMPALTYLDLSEVNITKLPNKSFYKATNVRQIILPQSLTLIGTSAFAESVIEEVFCYNQLEKIDDLAFSECINLRTITFSENLQTIGTSAFYSCTALTSLDFPASLRYLYSSAFENCTGVTVVSFAPNCQLKLLPQKVFHNCPITEIVIPAKVASISLTALFATSLERVDFEPGSELTLMDRYFPMSLRWIKIPASVTEITSKAFSYSKGDKIQAGSQGEISYSIPQSSPYYQIETVVFEPGSHLNVIRGGGLTSIYINESQYGSLPYGAFAGCKNMQTITIPASVSVLEAGCFAYCENLSNVVFEGQQLEELESMKVNTLSLRYKSPFWSSSFNNVSDYVSPFFCCNSLASINLPRVETIGHAAFKYCEHLSAVDIEYAGIIGAESFFGLKSLTVVTLPYVGTIDESAFKGCEYLASVELGKVGRINDDAFYGLYHLNSISLSQVDYIGARAFYKTPLSSLVFGETLTTIGKSAFGGSTSLRSVDFSSCLNLNEIGESAFMDQASLSSLSLPACLKTIGVAAFSGCTSLRTIVFAEDSRLEQIKNEAFLNCPTIRRFDARNCTMISSVGSKAFANSDAMQAFYIAAPTAPTCAADAFGNVGNYSVLKVPDESVSSYSAATGWSNFSSITGFNEGL